MRLDKYLCEAGIGTRSEVKRLIGKGLVTVNGEMLRDSAAKLDETSALVTVNGQPVRYAAFEYYLLNKPAGVISASRADLRRKDERCVVDLIETRLRSDLFPVGRLDKDTEGLLLITNDGALAHRLLSPKKHVDKTYFVRLSGALSGEARQRLEQGVDIGDEKPTLPCRLEEAWDIAEQQTSQLAGELPRLVSEQTPSRLQPVQEADETTAGESQRRDWLITIHEGRFHQIKRMAQAVGLEVVYLKRLSMGPLRLDETLAPGSYRALTAAELEALRQGTGV